MFSSGGSHGISVGVSSAASMQSSSDGGYDFTKIENAARWRGLFIPSLRKVLEQVNPNVTAKEDALLYVENLCVRLLAKLCTKPLPHSVQDVEEKVNKSFPVPIVQWALKEANEVINSKKRKSLLPTERVHTLLQKDVLQYKIDNSVSAYLVAVLECISSDILKMAAEYVCNISHCEIVKEDLEVVMNAERVLDMLDMLDQSSEQLKCNMLPSPLSLPTQRASATYEETVKELINDEKQYQRDLHMIIRVFREELVKIARDPKELEPIFSNIMDIYEVTVTLLGSLEDVIEMSQEQNAPCVASCFEELAEAEEFDVYKKYAYDVTSQAARDALSSLLANPNAPSLMSAGHGFREAVKYYLPKLLLVPICHAFVYFDYIKHLMDLSTSQDDIESFAQVQGLLHPLHRDLEKVMANLPMPVPVSGRVRRQMAIERTRELQMKVEHWDDKDVGLNCNEFIREDSLSKLGSGKRIWSERKVFLFDGLMVLCKANTKKQTPSAGATAYEYRLKEKFFMRRVEICDRADTEELKHSFELTTRMHPAIVLSAQSAQDKNNFMADLIMVNTKSMLDRILDSILQDIERKHPLRMPSPEIYKFAIPDSAENIVLEDRDSGVVPMIKGATLCKLIERLTYHIYADPTFVRTFLTTYRYFCSPQQLLTLLIERFEIPEPSLVYQEQPSIGSSGGNDLDKDGTTTAATVDSDKMLKNSQREDWKRYRKEFVQPVQFRVLNVLRHWVDHHFYDFEKDPTLLDRLLHFLNDVNSKSMRKWVDSVRKIVDRKNKQSNKKIVYAYGHDPPPIEFHLNVPEDEITLLTLHPLEAARQLTLLEFEMYKNVKPSELVGSPWTKKDKELKSPNLLKIMKHTTNVTRWIEKSIMEAENFDERLAIMQRSIEVMMVMLELNNFNGILSIVAAMGTAAVFRLRATFNGLPERHRKFLDECRELSEDHLKKYQERLRSINPPCVPFFGRYLTHILHLEEGNPDLLTNTELINFSKRRKVSEIIGEIQQYQNQPYCLNEEPTIRHFFEQLDPFNGRSDKEMSDYLYNESLRIEPRSCKTVPKFPRKWPNIPLKSPGIKPRRHNQNNNSNKLSNNAPINVEQPTASTSSTASAASSVGVGDQSPQHNPHAYSVFAPVIIPERNGGSTWSGISLHRTTDNGEVAPAPHLPRKPAAHVWTHNNNIAATDNFSPALSEQQLPLATAATAAANSSWGNVNDFYVSSDVSDVLPPSPLPKLMISPRHEAVPQPPPAGNRSPFHGRAPQMQMQYSPTHSIASTVTLIGGGLGDVSPQLGGFYYNSEQGQTGAVPISPHVNVPTATLEYRAVPPPLPPRRKERTESCADMAQKQQAPDAPTLPPRDGELSPPPIPPRLNHSMAAGYGRQPREFVGKSSSLLLPNTSSIMIRRNSAKQPSLGVGATTAAAATATALSSTNAIASTLINASHSSASTIASIGIASDEQQLQQQQPPQSISPALSSSTTTSPMTPMTPMSPYIPSTIENSTSSSYPHQARLRSQQQQQQQQQQPVIFAQQQQQQTHHHHHHHSQQLQQQHHHQTHHTHTHSHPHTQHHPSQLPNRRSSPKEFFPINTSHEGTPKLPPKPSLSANFYNNPDKGTMFLYPSTNQE
ncbi:protein son of sevenless [Drosophila sulfurigaster albostrigata]|uniref:protein son of sevenless n=1 Tax=Drosophila sulfurigaster albostrigata TaxID=89887 RepID=UPI002D21C600|nr:protein son of sevenless [Drosophila sulfurigaster albostrigata]